MPDEVEGGGYALEAYDLLAFGTFQYGAPYTATFCFGMVVHRFGGP
jgi:hypothetical protein